MNPIRHSLWMGDDDTMKLGDKVKDSNDNVCGSPVDIYSNLYDDLGEVEKDNSFIENNNSADKGPAGYDNTGPALVQMNHEATQHATCSYPPEVKSSSRPGSSASSPRRSESRPHRHRSRSREPRSRRSRSREHRRSSRRSRSRDRRHHRSRDYRRRSRSRDRRRSRSRDRRRRHDRSPDRYRHRGWNSGYPQQAENYAWTWNPPADGELSIQTICTSRGHYRRPLVSREQVDPSVYSIAGAPVPPAETTPLTEQELGQMLIQQHSLEPHGAGAMWAGTGLAPPGIGEIAPPGTGDATVPEASAPPNAPPSGASVSGGATASVTAGSVPPNGPGWAHYGYPGASQHKDKESRSQHEERQRSRDRDYDRHRSSRRDSDRRHRHSHHHQRSRSRDRGRHGNYRHGDSRSRDHSRERSEPTSQPKRSSNDRDKENDPSAPDDEESETKKPAKVDHKRRSSAGSDSRAPAGYCFVEFPTEEDGRKAMLRLSGKVIPNSKPPKLFKLNLASFGRDNDDTEYSLFIGDLTEEVDDLMLYTAFESKYKSVKMAKVVIDSSGVSRGYGFVRFGEEKEMKSALIHMQRYPHLGRKPIKVSLATPKSKRNPSSTYNSNNTSTSSTTNTSAATYNYSGYYNQNTAASTTTPAATDAATAAYNQQYYQSQQAAWWQAYQMPPGSSGGYYGGYPSDYNYDQTATTEQPQPTQPQAEAAADESEELEDPGFDIDVAKMNEAYMERSEELYTALEESRWQPIDNLMCAPSAAAVKS